MACDQAELAGRNAHIAGDDEISEGIARRLARAGAKLTKAFDALDILVLNPLGAAAPAPLAEQGADAFAGAFACVSDAAAMMIRALPAFQARKGGRIILIGHRYGESVSEGLGPYNAAACSLVGLMRTAAVEWGQFGVTTNLVIPFADTAELRAARVQRPKIIGLMTSQTPLGRAGDPAEDIGGAVVYLASEDAGFVNGQVVHVDGGQHIAGPVLNPIRFRPS